MIPTESKPQDWEFYLTSDDLGVLINLMKRNKANAIYFSSNSLIELREDIDQIVYDKELLNTKN